jgi:hypothetical protein
VFVACEQLGSFPLGQLAGRDLTEVRQLLQCFLWTSRVIEWEHSYGLPTSVDRGVEDRIGNIDDVAGLHLEWLAIIEHLLTLSLEDVENLLRLRMIMSVLTNPRLHHDLAKGYPGSFSIIRGNEPLDQAPIEGLCCYFVWINR